MKRLLRISALLLVYCISTAKSCDGPGEEKTRDQDMVVSARDSIRSAIAFGSGSLSEESLRAFEESAKQKLYDLSDYRRILADSSLDRAFRSQAAEMIHGLFLADAVMMHDSNLETPVFDSVKVLLPLHPAGDNRYTGELSCLETGVNKHSAHDKTSSTSMLTVDIHLVRRATVMGRDTLHSWKVFLGKFH